MTTQERPLPGAWGVTALIFLFMVINFADKAVLGLAAKPIMDELKLTPEQFGLLGSVFFLLFPVSAVLVGFASNNRPARRMLLGMAVLWSVVQFPLLGPATFGLLIANRVLLGVAEGPAYPVAMHGVYKWFPDSLRALPTAVIAQGSSFGVIAAVPLLNVIIIHLSWHWAFAALGVAGVAWAIAWAILGREGTLVDGPATQEQRVPYRHLLLLPTLMATCIVGFAAFWGLALVMTWLTAYLVEGLKFSQALGGDLSVLPWLSGAVVVLAGGAISQALKTRGYSSRVSRGLFPCATIVLGGVVLLFLGATDQSWLKVAVVVAGTALGGTIFVVVPMIVSELSPQPQRAAMLAIVNSVMTLGGIAAPLIMGGVLQHAASPLAGYERGFLILGLLQIAGGLVGLLFIRPEADRPRLQRHRVSARAV
ncbi:MAG: MFS transporter [Reyranellaceae bacterium]